MMTYIIVKDPEWWKKYVWPWLGLAGVYTSLWLTIFLGSARLFFLECALEGGRDTIPFNASQCCLPCHFISRCLMSTHSSLIRLIKPGYIALINIIISIIEECYKRFVPENQMAQSVLQYIDFCASAFFFFYLLIWQSIAKPNFR